MSGACDGRVALVTGASKGSTGTAIVLPMDLADPDGGSESLVARVSDLLGQVDILVNNAAANGYRPFEQWTTTQLDLAFEVNVRAPWQLMAEAALALSTCDPGVLTGRVTRSLELLAARGWPAPFGPDPS